MSSAESVAVVHPVKVGGLDSARERLARWAHEAGVPTPHVVGTTADSPGTEQARAAVEAGADLVLAWGGDGTVTATAAGLVGTDVPLGILPGGTGNLLARNLGLPLDEADAAAIAFGGADRRIDTLDIGLGGRSELGTVIAGMGLDAALIDAPEGLKDAIGPGAYVVNAVRAFRHRTMRVGVAVDDGLPRWFHARSVIVANVGGLIAGLDVAPEADASDGTLHVVVLPLATPADWVRTGVRLVSRRQVDDASRTHMSGRSAWIVARTEQPRQVDGDLVGDGRVIQARVRPASLLVRVPAGG
ncbi:MAG: diacylglycerol kinase family protein [Candidatus Nanopelagicales bacterium]